MRVDPAGKLLLGLGTGVAFGALLQKGQVAKYDVILNQLLLRDSTVAKVMGTAVAVGAAGVYGLVAAGRAKLDVKPLKVGGIVGGAALFGAGMALLGYCPGTTLAAVGEGDARRRRLWEDDAACGDRHVSLALDRRAGGSGVVWRARVRAAAAA